MRRQAVRRLTLTDFRCYAHQRIEPDSRSVLLIGPNGAGKTNLLEALSYLVPGRGLRSARLSEVARRAEGGNGSPEEPADPSIVWAVAARIEGPDGPVELGSGRGPAPSGGGRERRLVHIDGLPVKGQAALADHLSMLWLTPQMDRLFLEGASARRRFLDRLVFGLDPAHAGRVTAYEHALRERSKLLRRSRENGRLDPDWISVLEDTMATKGVAVAAARRELAGRLATYCGEAGRSFPGAAITVIGDVEGWLEDSPALEAEDRFRQALVGTRDRDAHLGGAGAGPQRSDFSVRHLAKDQVADQCSTGEQKALLIAIVLANARLQTAERGSAPILLLDEVAAHLDQTRRRALFDELEELDVQAWITGTDASLFTDMGERAQRFDVDEGRVSGAAS